MAGDPPTDALKKHSPFAQIVLRKSGETSDLAGKAVIAFSGIQEFFKSPASAFAHPWVLATALGFGSVLVVTGIYLQAKAEETQP